MPSRSRRRKAPLSAAGWALACVAAALASGALLAACERTADIRDERDASLVSPGPELDAGEIPLFDSGLGTDAYPLCADRPVGDCVGPIDFPCQFQSWVHSTAEACQQATGCKTNGWLEVRMGANGCVEALGMDAPNDDMIACLLATFGAERCPCGEASMQHFFGIGNTGTCP